MYQKVALALTLAMFGQGCGPAVNSGSNLSHEVGNPTNDDPASKWHIISDASMQSVVTPLYAAINGNQPQKLLPKDHSVVTRLTYWVDRLHQRLVKKYPDEMKKVVKPRVNVIITETPNAFVMPVPVCYDVNVVINETLEADPSNTIGSVAMNAQGSIGRPWSGNLCVKSDAGADFFAQYVKDFNKLGLKCQLGYNEDDNALSLGEKCQIPFQYSVVAAATRLVMYPTAGMITVHSGLLSIMSEEEVVSVLAHELGHYYKVHAGHAFADSYDYYYTLKEANDPIKPIAESQLKELGEAAKNTRLTNAVYRDVAGQKFRSEMFVPVMIAGSILSSQQKCDEGDCNEACDSFAEFTKDPEFRNKMGKFPFAKLNVIGAMAYKEFETKAAACFAGVKVSDEGAETGAGISAELVARALTYDRNVAALFAGTTVQDTLIATLAEAQAKLKENELKLTKALRVAAAKNVGQYTTEQEADELSVEWMVELGLSPEAVVSSEFVLGNFVKKIKDLRGLRSHPTTMSIGRCESLYKNKWRDENGNYTIVAIGDYSDPHHSSCFRAFNADREIDAHDFPREATETTEGAPGGTWQEMQAAAKKAVEDNDSSLTTIDLSADGVEADALEAEFVKPLQSCTKNQIHF